MINTSVSIITPVHNGKAFLGQTIGSVLQQSHMKWEWIIVNDGSRDRTQAILNRLADPRIRVVHQENAGVSAARNTGLDCARGDYVTFLDADDILPPDALRDRVSYLEEHPEVDIANGRIRLTRDGTVVGFYEPGKTIAPLFPRLSRLEKEVFFGPFYMLRRPAIGAHRFPAGITHCEDIIFFLELAHDRNLIYGAVDSDVYEYRLNPNSAMSNLSGIEAGYLALLARAAKLQHLAPEGRREMRMRIASILAKSWLRQGRPIRAITAGLRALAQQ